MKVVIIGTGNVAAVMGNLLKNAGYNIVQVFGRNPGEAAKLANELNAHPCHIWAAVEQQAGLYLVAISDTALYTLNQHLRLSGQLIVHTAGSVSKEVLRNISDNHGVLYPLQSLRKELAAPGKIPLMVDASNEASMRKVLEIGERLSSLVVKASDEERLKLHIAAIVVNNFTNHMYAVAEEYCIKEHLPFPLLWPLATETAERLKALSPGQAMTGPAVRKDTVTINRHLELLQEHPFLQTLYAQLTESIQQFRIDVKRTNE